MEFWGVEVKAGETLKVSPGEGNVIHLSQASIGESKKGKDEMVPVHVKIGEQKLVIGTLSAEKFPQIQYDVVFEKDFELSHNGKNGSVFFCGYKTQNPEDDEVYSGDDFDSDSEDEELTLPIENGKTEPAKAAAKPVPAAKPAVKAEELAKADSDEDSSDDDDFSDSESDDELSDDGDDKMDADDSDEEDGSSEEDEKTPTPKKENKKRPTESESKAQIPSKKAKLATPQKTDGKVTTAHIATPHPSKPASKTPKTENTKTPASAGKVTCNSCSKTFNSDKALESHSKAKHAAK
ncbi:unnamed protein product [Rhodiola kirilowii]